MRVLPEESDQSDPAFHGIAEPLQMFVYAIPDGKPLPAFFLELP
jgi:hypothetical protein